MKGLASNSKYSMKTKIPIDSSCARGITLPFEQVVWSSPGGVRRYQMKQINLTVEQQRVAITASGQVNIRNVNASELALPLLKKGLLQ